MLTVLSQRLAFRASHLTTSALLRPHVVASNTSVLTSRAWSRSFVSTPLWAYPAKAAAAKTTAKKPAAKKPAAKKPAAKKPAAKPAAKTATKKVSRIAAKKPAAKRVAKKVVKPKVTRVPKEDRPPKRPPTSYLNFFIDYSKLHAGSVTASTPRERIQALSKMSGQAWRELSESQQAPYRAKYKQDLEEYRKALKAYYERIDDATIRAINREKSKKGQRKIATRTRALGLPKKSLSSFMLKSHPTITKDDMLNVARAAGEAWHKLTPEQKAAYSRPAE